MSVRGCYGVRIAPGEHMSTTYPGFVRKIDGTLRRSRAWVNSKTGIRRHVSQILLEVDCGACGEKHLCLKENSKRQKTFSCSVKCKNALLAPPEGNKKSKSRTHGKGAHVLIRASDHPSCDRHGYVPEHRLVMEKKIGRYLRPEERVHHVNMIKADNRPDNLSLCANDTEHFLSHGSLNACVAELINSGVLGFDHQTNRYFTRIEK